MLLGWHNSNTSDSYKQCILPTLEVDIGALKSD